MFEINYIIYNNRSTKLVENFLPKVNLLKFLEIERKLNHVNSLFPSLFKINFNESDFVSDYKDILYTKEDISLLKDKILNNSKNISNSVEYKYLIDRGLNIDIIKKYNIGYISDNWSKRELDIIGFSEHTLFKNILNQFDQIGIIIPLFDSQGVLINICSRKLESGIIKYTLAVPDVHIWGIENMNEGEECWICEGVFDYIGLNENGFKNPLSVASASWSTIQLYQLLDKKPSLINIFSDYDYTGLRSSLVLDKFFILNGIRTKTWVSNSCKDASEHFFERKLSVEEVEEIKITTDLLDLISIDIENIKKDYISYLKVKTF